MEDLLKEKNDLKTQAENELIFKMGELSKVKVRFMEVQKSEKKRQIHEGELPISSDPKIYYAHHDVSAFRTSKDSLCLTEDDYQLKKARAINKNMGNTRRNNRSLHSSF